MLVRPFKVKVSGTGDSREHRSDAMVCQTRIHPYVHDVGGLLILPGNIYRQLLGFHLIPCIYPALLNRARDMLEDFHTVRMWFAALAIDKQRDRHSPGPLPRNTPVR